MAQSLLEKVYQNKKLQSLHHLFEQDDSVLIEGLWNGPKALIAALCQRATGKNLLILTSESQEELRLFHDLEFFFQRKILDFPAWETLPSEQIAPSPDVVGERYQVLEALEKQKR